jgi:ribonuclease P protein subunit POP4
MDKKNLHKCRFIGKKARIVECTDLTWINIYGQIIDESKNTFLIEKGKKKRRIAKNIAKFEFKDNNDIITINGLNINYRCEDRLKKTR